MQQVDVVRRRVAVSGIVQGVGLRPAVHRHARSLGLAGFVGNDGDGAFVEVEGPAAAVDAFLGGLADALPPLAVVDDVAVVDLSPAGDTTFRIVESRLAPGGSGSTSVAPDVAPCDACLRELHDPADRRYGYPFLNCTDCGPRYSIVRGLPYDRARTTMAGFTMCDACRAEYEDPLDRRFHAQPTCCPACGPRLELRDASFEALAVDDVVGAVVERLRAGAVVAVKGVGGYHLAVDATDRDAVRRLRERKHREARPLALLVADLAAVRALAEIGRLEEDLLRSPERPIVLLRRRADAPVCDEVAPGNRALGVLLPPSPLHVLLAERHGDPLVLTSANRSSEPLVHREADAASRLAGIADWYCTHDRPVHVRVDDSVTRVVGDRQIVVRRARGHAPRPVRVLGGFPRHTLACGAALKSTVCVGRDDRAVVSQHLGDLENHETSVAFEDAVAHLCRLLAVEPRVVAHDLHPDFRSTAFAHALAAAEGIETVGVQHHHAHVAACLADNEHPGPVLGIAFDGMGFGTDGTAWGGEVLRADLAGFERLGHLATVPLPGGDAAVREPWRMAAMHLRAALGADELTDLAVRREQAARWTAVTSMADAGVYAPLTSSAGRLFDAVSAILGVRHHVSYEGQAAIELEQRVDPAAGGSYPVSLGEGTPFVIDTAPTIRALVGDLRAGVPTGTIAGRFHRAVVDLVRSAAARGRAITGLSTVALSGGVFQNALLVEWACRELGADGFEVLTHRRFPPNDGGISLGQAVVVAARDRAGGH